MKVICTSLEQFLQDRDGYRILLYHETEKGGVKIYSGNIDATSTKKLVHLYPRLVITRSIVSGSSSVIAYAETLAAQQMEVEDFEQISLFGEKR